MPRGTAVKRSVVMAVLVLSAVLAAPVPARAAGECRALVNLELPDGGQRVLDLRLGTTLALSRHTGLALGAGKDVVQLRRAGRQDVEGDDGPEVDWHLLQGRAVAGGDFVAWLDVTPDLPTPEELREAMGPDAPVDALEASHSLEVLSVFGPYVSLGITRGGYVGGAHGYDDPGVVTLQAPTGKDVDLRPLLGEQLMATVRAHIDAAVKAAPDTFDGMGPPDVEDLKSGAGLSLGDAGPSLRAFMSCCTWAANHNLYELELPLPQTPPGLAAVLPTKGTWRGPDGCSVTQQEGALLPRGPGGAELPEVGLAEETLLGVAWVAPDAPALRPDDELYTEALAAARRLAAEKKPAEALEELELAMEARPNDATAQAEAGWILFGQGRHGDARALLEAGLASAGDDAKLRAICLYNLGRVDEATGAPSKAAERYRESLKLRPNDTVRKRLEDLQAAGPTVPGKAPATPTAPGKATPAPGEAPARAPAAPAKAPAVPAKAPEAPAEASEAPPGAVDL